MHYFLVLVGWGRLLLVFLLAIKHHRADQLDGGAQPAVAIDEVTFIEVYFKR